MEAKIGKGGLIAERVSLKAAVRTNQATAEGGNVRPGFHARQEGVDR